MGTCTSLPAPPHFTENDVLVPKHGVAFSYFLAFIADHGGREAFTGLSTADVYRNFIAASANASASAKRKGHGRSGLGPPAAAASQMSICEALRDQQHPLYRESADVYVIHSWQCDFLELVDVLSKHLQNDNMAIWIDLFSGTNAVPVHDYELWANSFRSTIQDIGSSVLVLGGAWEDAIPLRRSWCLFELYCTQATGCKFDIAMSAEVQQGIIAGILDNPLVMEKVASALFSKVDFVSSRTFNAEDKAMIEQVVIDKVTGGLERLNNVVTSLICDTVVRRVVHVHNDRKASLSKSVLRDFECLQLISYASNLASLYLVLGCASEAEPLLVDNLTKCRAAFGDNHVETLASVSALGALYESIGKLDLAQPLLEECMTSRKSLLGHNNPETLLSMFTLATVYASNGKFVLAEQLFVRCRELQEIVLGVTHADTIETSIGLANVYSEVGKYADAKALYLDCLEKRERVLGDLNPLTLAALHGLATVHADLGQLEDSKYLMLDCLNKRIKALGKTNLDTLSSMNNLGSLYKTMGNFAEAEAILEDCVMRYREAVGDSHLETLAAINNLAGVYVDRRKFDKAEELFVDCIRKQKKVLGAHNHPTVLATANNLAGLYYRQGRYEEAESLYSDNLVKMKSVLGHEHPHTVLTLKNWKLASEAIRKDTVTWL